MLLLALNLERAMFVLSYYPWLLLFPFSSTPLNIKGNDGGNIVQLGLNYSSDINTYYWINSETMPHFRYVIRRLIAEEKKSPKRSMAVQIGDVFQPTYRESERFVFHLRCTLVPGNTN